MRRHEALGAPRSGGRAGQAEAPFKMDRSISVRTPESIAFSYELAGLGSRFLALAADMFIQVVIFVGLMWGIFYASSRVVSTAKVSTVDRTAESIVYAAIIAVLFLIFFGYFIAFEGFWNGQTPGKRMLGIRVVRDGGYSIDLGASFIRNLVRVGELALGFYAVSAIVSLISPENKRLGDLAAGTIVVRDARAQSLTAIRERAEEGNLHRAAMLSDDEVALIGRFIARRGTMDPQHRRRMASQIAGRVRTRVSSDLQRLDDEDLLERLNAFSS